MNHLKPITFVKKNIGFGAQDTTKQIMLLKAMTVTSDPKKLRDMIGVKSVAEVYKTIDKMAMRKEYHRALFKLGIDFEFIAAGIKNVCENAEDEGVRLKGFQTLLKSLGVDSYKDEDGVGASSWEEALLKNLEENKNKEIVESEYKDYEVTVPQIPESVKQQRKMEQELGKGIYE